MLVWWTNRSRLPSSGVMKPKPFSSLNHFTVPVGISDVLRGSKCCYRGASTSDTTGHCTCFYRQQAAVRGDRSMAGGQEAVVKMEDPMQIGRHAAIPLNEVVLRASRSSGPGGQHANVTASRIEAIFDVDASAALSPEQKRRVTSRLGRRVTAVAQDARSQSRNRELALERLQQRLTSALAVTRPRTATKPTRASVQRRLESKRRQSSRKHERRRPERGDD